MGKTLQLYWRKLQVRTFLRPFSLKREGGGDGKLCSIHRRMGGRGGRSKHFTMHVNPEVQGEKGEREGCREVVIYTRGGRDEMPHLVCVS